jgi:AcrR family transcriptional regulator
MTQLRPEHAPRSIRSGRPRKADAAALVDHVVEVADQLFLADGYAETSMTAVAASARVGKQTLYRRFPDKPSLFREVIRRRMERLGSMAKHPGPPLEQLRELGAQALAIVSDDTFTALNRILVAEAVNVPDLAATITDYWEQTFVCHLVESIEAAQREGSCIEGDPDLFARWFLWGLIGDRTRQSLLALRAGPSPAEQQVHLDRVWPLFVRAITPEKH